VRKLMVLVFVVLSSVALTAQVTLPRVLSSHMVIQRDLPVHVWGNAAPGEPVSVSFRGEQRGIESDPLGHWSIYLKPGPAGGPFQLSVKGIPSSGAAEQPITLDDIMVGDVWVASGQSNMEFPLSHAATAPQDVPNSANPQIRLLMVRKRSSDYAMPDADTDGWALSTPDTAKDFSAVAWYFARDIASRQHVTVGVIDATWGGTVGESWVRLTALGEDASLAPIFVARGKMTDKAGDAVAEEKDEQRQIAEAKAAGKVPPQFPWHPPLNSWGPGLLWNGMIAPLTPLPIRGVIWYQGESNSALARVHSYDRIMRTLIEDWRRQWGWAIFLFSTCRSPTTSPLRSKTGPNCAISRCALSPCATPRWPSPSTLAILITFIPLTSSTSASGSLALPAPSATARQSSTQAPCSARPLPRVARFEPTLITPKV
jgi:sialate O-acetylesterase